MKNNTSGNKSVTAKEADSVTPVEQTANFSEPNQNITGRAVFAVDTTAAGIAVRTAFLSEQGQVIDMPAVFPDLTYALNQIDHLRQIVLDRFSQAAQVGVQVIAANAAQQNAARTDASVTPTGQAAEVKNGEPTSA